MVIRMFGLVCVCVCVVRNKQKVYETVDGIRLIGCDFPIEPLPITMTGQCIVFDSKIQ